MLIFGPRGFFGGIIVGSIIILLLWKRQKDRRRRMLESLLYPPQPQPPPLDSGTPAFLHPPPLPESRQQVATQPYEDEAHQQWARDTFGIGGIQVTVSTTVSSTRSASPAPSPKPNPPSAERIPLRYETTTATRPPVVKKLQWLPPGETTKLGGRMVNGMVYVAEASLGWDGEPSAINRRLAVDSNQGAGEELPYYPNYEALNPGQRAFYLDWLATDRRMQDPNDLPTGYLFLFFYGIERRVLVEGDRDPAIWEEVLRLLATYGLTRRSRSVPSYFGDFLHFTAYSAGADNYAKVLDRLLDAQGERLSETALNLALAQRFRAGEPIHWRIGHLVAMGLEESRRSVVIKRTGDAFREMFAARFQESFPGGMELKASKRDASVRYQTGNATLAPRYSGTCPFQLRVPGVVGLQSQFKPLAKIWNQCIEDLSGYSRAVGKVAGASNASIQDQLAAYLSLPEELRRTRTHPLDAPYRNALAGCPAENGITFAPVAVLANLIGLEERPMLTQRQSEDVADLVESFGDTLAPHPAILNLPLAWDQEVAICWKPEKYSLSKGLGGLLRLLHLAVLIASADGVIDESELEVFHQASGINDEFGRIQIKATEAVLVRDTNVAASRIQKIAKSIHASERMAVFKLLVHVACCDEVLSSDENRLLRRIAKALQLDSRALDDVLSEDSSFQTVTVVRGRGKAAGEAIPQPATIAKPAAFSLDMDRISTLTAETAEVVSILSRALEEEGEEAEIELVATVPEKPPTLTPEWMANLDDRYKPALVEMLATTNGHEFDIDTIAENHHLLPDDLIDGINSWSDEALGDFLIETDDDGGASIVRTLIPTH